MAPKVTRTLVDELGDFTRKQGPKCSVGLLIKGSQPDYAEQIVELLALPVDVAPNTAVMRLLKSHGADTIAIHALARHRLRECQCNR